MRIEKNVKVIISLFMPNEFPSIINSRMVNLGTTTKLC